MNAGWGLLTAVLGCFAVTAAAQQGPTLRFSDTVTQARLTAPYQSALDNLLQTNTVPIPASSEAGGYNQTGLLSKQPNTFIRAGGGYHQPWTRDASVNSWSAASLLEPAAARNTLLAVLKREPDGKLIIQQDNQWWDQVIWITAAWNHYLVTGDRAFLASAYEAAANTLARRKAEQWNVQYSLFQGPSFLNDGIAGYPAPPADATESRGSFVLAYPGADKTMALSTNCLYVAAYRNLARMAHALGKPAGDADGKADALAASIRNRFWLPAHGRFGYLLRPDGSRDDSQESAGEAFALLFGIASPEQAASILKTVQTTPHGIPDSTPAFTRFSVDHPGRHNVIVWPPIEAFWAQAAAEKGDAPAFAREMDTLADLVNGSGGKFWEIYNGTTGKPDGGWQVGHEWTSEQDQTWSATGYLRMVYLGLFGMRFGEAGLSFAPTLPEKWGPVTLSGMRYRGAELTIKLSGAGQKVRSMTLDGKPGSQIPAALIGAHTVAIVLGS